MEGTDLRLGRGVVQSSLQGVAQTLGQVLLQDEVQAVPTQLDGQNCGGRMTFHSMIRRVFLQRGALGLGLGAHTCSEPVLLGYVAWERDFLSAGTRWRL